MIRLFLAVLRRDILIESTYRFAYLMRNVNGLAVIFLWYFLAQTRYGEGMFSFAVTGIVFLQTLHVAVGGFARRVREEQITGTLEEVLAVRGQIVSLLAAWIGRDLITRFCMGALMLYVAGLLGVHYNIHGVSVLVVGLLAFLCFAAFGIATAAAVVLYKRAEALAAMFMTASTLVGDTFFPVDILPAPIAALAHWFPLTVATRAARAALLDGAEPAALAEPIRYLAISTVVLLPWSCLLFSWAVRRARVSGTLGQF